MENYKTMGVCSVEIQFDIQNNQVKNVSFIRGCAGNALGISKLVEGLQIEEVIDRLKGIECGTKGTSCPDQLAKALSMYIQAQ